ncbi:uncharacterized protein CEXT_482441 [Caerostris extrusa]|uniref:Uncharacterized protein n=1 Tax=Caerostris extrusa TaxID=172846 RepID=A0AAV4XRA8_CAEEX|nr:uncharacterized protein CEXT_482441 [Caerostris extrusa]
MNNRQEMVHRHGSHKKNNFLIDPSKEASSQAMKDGKTAVIASRYFLTSQLHNIFISDDSFFSLTRSVVIKRGFCCTDELDMLILRICSAGLYKKLLDDELFRIKLKEELLNPSEFQTPIQS